ncbi:MAG: hypothetical protein QOC81_4963 [Thermoanaerobaculia bacterium]|jgi:FtsP/CotA-like multicopper oxidase with cupredoxin domain|nr:hypothetical protein [Thermoanaerobaculia bacterium]
MRDKELDRKYVSTGSFWLTAMFLAAAVVFPAAPATAQWITCLGDGGDTTKPPIYLPTVPEIVYGPDGNLRATVVLVSEQERISFRNPSGNQQGAANTTSRCANQWVRVFKGVGAVPTPPNNGTPYPDPMPGPTLRAEVGKIAEITFLNQVDPNNFSDSIDRGDYKTGTGCDETSFGYPGAPPGGDTYPNCFHGSSTANLHFHGTHTSPSSTADNVFIEIRPSPRKDGKPVVTEDTYKSAFNTFYGNCERILGANPLTQWPRIWGDLPVEYTGLPLDKPAAPMTQRSLLQAYDLTPNIKPLWPVNERQIKTGAWPQYYVGAFPYCFRLPAYTGDTFPPKVSATVAHTPQSHGAGSAEQQATHSGEETEAGPDRPVMMGQAPGTHWYHAHKHGSTAIDISNGMTGAFIIEGDYDKQLDGYYGAGWARKQPVMVINQIGVSPNLERGPGGRQARGPDLSVNGRLNPIVRMKPGEVQLWRILNTTYRAGVYFAANTSSDPPGPTEFVRMQLAQDGVQFNAANYAASKNKALTLASGNRADLLMKAPTQKGQYKIIVRNVVNPGQNTGNQITLFTVEVTDDPPATPPLSNLLPTDSTFPLKFPPFLQDITAKEVSGTRKITFATWGTNAPPNAPTIHTIDGKQFNGEVGEVVLLNRVEEWQVFNATTNIEHPFHIHINPFQVTEVLDVSVKLPKLDGTGTIVMTAGSPTVKGTDTSFGRDKQIRVGYTITAGGTTGTVKSIESETSLTLSANAAASASGAFTFVVPKYVGDRASLNVPGQCYIDPYQPLEPAVNFPDPSHPNDPKLCGGETRVPPPRIWWDVFPMPLGVAATTVDGVAYMTKEAPIQPIILPGYFKMRSRFVDYPGFFVIHCHILSHEDRGMMTVVDVVPLSSPYSHH